MVVDLVKFELMGYSSLKEFQDDFMNTLLQSVRGYDFFVDWKKVEENAREHLIEWGLLNALTIEKNMKRRKELLAQILKEHPRVMECVPILLAVREDSLDVVEISNNVICRQFTFKTNFSQNQIDDAILFFEKTGLLELFDKIKDTYTYVLGVEVGLDSNARKNRSGTVFNGMIERLISKTIKKLNGEGYAFSYTKETKVNAVEINKKVDFLISLDLNPLVACEVNVYHGSGSKPSEVTRAYVTLNEALNKKGLHFIWFTDGCGWKDMQNPFNEAAQKVEFIMNYSQAAKYLEAVLKNCNNDEQEYKKR